MLFAALALAAAFAIPAWTGGNWTLTIAVLTAFLVVYLFALRWSSRWLGEDGEGRAGDRDKG